MDLLLNVVWLAIAVLGVALVGLYYLNRSVDQTDYKSVGPE